jgi:hypothetical protein
LLLLVEFCLIALLLPFAFAAPRAMDSWFRAIEHRALDLAAHRGVAVLTVLFLALGLRIAVLPVEPIPVPGIHDEFGYLLSGDTFAHGRLTNPTHPMWVHFESMTIIQHPTYSSAFYAAQGFFIALGQVLFRHPFWGVWLSTGLMCASITWALQGWMPPSWAFLGGLLSIMRLGTFTYWVNSYWGGSVAALGGALVLGALPRIKRHQRVRDATLMGAGLALLANSRPYEGLFYSLPILVALTAWMFAKRARLHWVVSQRRVVLPLAILMTITFAFMAYYFWRTTGDPLKPPYLVDVATYMQEPIFIWQSLRPPPVYHHAVMQQFYSGFHVQLFLDAKHGPIIGALRKMAFIWLFFIGPPLAVPFFILGGILPYGMSLRDFGCKARFLLILVFISMLGLLLPIAFFSPHYAAPMVCAVYALIVQAMRRVRIWDRHGKLKGAFAIRAVVSTCVLSFLISLLALAWGVDRQRLFILDPSRQNTARAELIEKLSQLGGKHLILVHYGREHDLHNEWVYNDADIDNSKIVWAREMTLPEDAQLISYFKDRQAWLLQPDGSSPSIAPYPDTLNTTTSVPTPVSIDSKPHSERRPALDAAH